LCHLWRSPLQNRLAVAASSAQAARAVARR
jgi:hypothetical protein